MYYQRLSSLSGGQLQKVNILSRIFPTKSILIFDEPTSFLDSSSKEWFYLLLKRMKSNSIIILISHDDYFNDLVDYAIDMDVDSRDIYGRKE